MRKTLGLPLTPDVALTQALHTHISNAQFDQAGVWQLQRVRIDLPLALAQNVRLDELPWCRLCQWLAQQALVYQIAGVNRADIGLQLDFEKY
jgi:hypothetical protein